MILVFKLSDDGSISSVAWGITSKVKALVTDNARNMTAVFNYN